MTRLSPSPAPTVSTPVPTPTSQPADAASTGAPARWGWLAALAVLLGGSALVWNAWQQRQATALAASAESGLRLEALASRVEGLRRDHRGQAQRLQQAEATNRVLRDELLGLAERSAIIEESFARFTDPARHGSQALRLDEVELLLSLGEQRLRLAGDLDGARRAYALADGVLGGVDDPAYLSLHQTLRQERAALAALDAAPQVRALARLDAFATALAAAATVGRRHDDGDRAPWWQRAFGRIITVAPSDRAVAVHPADVAAARAGLQLEMSLARAAAGRHDADGYRVALRRTGSWLERLIADPEVVRARRAELDEIAAMPLSLAIPTLGTTLDQLRQLRATRREPVE